MNIVIPMAGIGSRFSEAGFTLPKPLIDVNGEPMIVKALKSLHLPGNYHFVIRKDEHTTKIRETITALLPLAKFIEVDQTTSGPASSVLLFENDINNEEELVVANCDQILWWNAEMFLHNARHHALEGLLVTYYSDTPKNSYARLNRKGLVTEVREKKVISTVSLNGIHYWRRGRNFVASAKEMISLKDTAPNGEFYVGPTYNYLIKQNFRIGIYHIPNEQHHAVGTPEDLAKYINLENEKV